MPVKTVVQKSDTLNLSAVLREKIGADVLDAPAIHHVLAEHIRTTLKVADTSKIPNRFWGRIMFVTDLLQRARQLEGDARFDIPSIDAPAEDLVDFYEFVMTFSESMIEFFREGFRKFDPVPNANGGQDASASKSASISDSTQEMSTEMTAIPA